MMTTADIQGLESGEKAGLSGRDASGTGGDGFRFCGYRTGETGWQGKAADPGRRHEPVRHSRYPLCFRRAMSVLSFSPCASVSTIRSVPGAFAISRTADIPIRKTSRVAIRLPIRTRRFQANSGISYRRRPKAMMSAEKMNVRSGKTENRR